MTQAGTQPSLAPPANPVRAALDNSIIAHKLRIHAMSRYRGVRVNREELIDDTINETIRVALEKGATFDPNRGSVAAWLYGIMNNVISEQRRKFHKQPVQLPTDLGGWDSVVACLEVSDHSCELAKLLTALPPDQRKLITWHHLDGLSHEEIAVRLNISAENSRTRLARAMLAVRQHAVMGGVQ